MTTRAQDESLLLALAMLRDGKSMAITAAATNKDHSNLMKSVRAVLRDDLEHDDPFDVLPHYPHNLITGRVI